jgi:glycosyltransferase involved in cell wall biosynthesis
VKSSVFKNSVGDRKGLGLPENKKIALMVSALIGSKRVDKAIEAVARINDLHLVVAGDGPERDKIALLAAQLLPGRFTRVTLAPGDMPRLYHSADVFLHMSQAEAFGNVFVEALACGLPVVAHDIPRHRWVVGDTGFFADTESVDATASALHLALASGSGERQKRINWVDRYDWKLVADQYETFFASLLAGRKA